MERVTTIEVYVLCVGDRMVMMLMVSITTFAVIYIYTCAKWHYEPFEKAHLVPEPLKKHHLKILNLVKYLASQPFNLLFLTHF